MTIFPRSALAAALLLGFAACGSGGDDAADVATDTVVVPAGSIDVIGESDDRARAGAAISDAAVQARDSAVDALSRDASGGN
jgi:hypothetical protein